MKFALVLFTLFFSLSVFAGIRDVGSGGAGILKDGKLYLLDLFEIGLEEPAIDFTIKEDQDVLVRAAAMPHFGSEEQKLFAKKITEIRRVAPRFANVLLLAMSKYQWYLVDTPLALIKEETPLDLSKFEMVQIANRLENRIRIYRPYWEILTPLNRVALVIHELVYSIHRPVMVSREKAAFSVDAVRVRSIVAWALSSELTKSSLEAVEQITLFSANASRLRDSYLLNLDEDVAILNGYLDMGVRSELERQLLCNEIGRQLQSVSMVSVQREMHASWSELYFSNYQTMEGSTQFTLRLSTRALGLDARTPEFWKDVNLKQPGLEFTKGNFNDCMRIVKDSHAQSIQNFLKL